MPNLLSPVDRFLDRLTSYRLVLYSLYVFFGWGILASLLNQVPFKWYYILLSTVWLILLCRGSGHLFARLFKVARSNNSDYITALILALILSPAATPHDFVALSVAGVVAIASKYLLVINRRHLFNPAALGAFLVGRLFDYFPSWWVGTKFLAPVVVLAGFLILRKVQRFQMVGLFLTIYLIILSVSVTHSESAASAPHNLWIALIASPLLFFSTIMLTEPSTSPSVTVKYLPYAGLVAVLYGITSLHVSPEEALLIGNIAAFAIEPYKRLRLRFVKKQKEAEGIYSFRFKTSDKFSFRPGQYMEWTLPGAINDTRGNRRYLTVASAPSEKEVMIAVRLPKPSSQFKKHLDILQTDQTVMASRLSGSFVLPKDKSQKLAFIAGGIGVTPFRSMAKELINTGEKRPISLLYLVSEDKEQAFKDVFKVAESVGVQTEYITGQRLNAELVKQNLPDFMDRRFYVSGPYGFVDNAKKVLRQLGVPRRQIISDYFPGYA